MRQIRLQARLHDYDAQSAFLALSDFGAFPEHCESVRAVEVQSIDTREAISTWEVDFQNGILKWQERDYFDRARLRIRFEQIAGDVDHFSGVWSIRALGEDCEVTFDAQFDLGIPMLADMLDPVAQKALEENIWSIMHGLFLDRCAPVATGRPA